ncbi:hypothetical protein Tco_1240309, partial [Tanacetum coccineum]
MGSKVQESKEKKVEGSEETAKGSKKKMRRRMREGKESDEVMKLVKMMKIHKEGMLVHYQLIRAYGSSKRYSSMIRMLQGIDREDLEDLWKDSEDKV